MNELLIKDMTKQISQTMVRIDSLTVTESDGIDRETMDLYLDMRASELEHAQMLILNLTRCIAEEENSEDEMNNLTMAQQNSQQANDAAQIPPKPVQQQPSSPTVNMNVANSVPTENTNMQNIQNENLYPDKNVSPQQGGNPVTRYNNKDEGDSAFFQGELNSEKQPTQKKRGRKPKKELEKKS